MWWGSGNGVEEGAHSGLEGRWDEKIKGRCAAILSHKIKIKKISAINEIIDPTEDNEFQSAYESG